MSKYDTKHIDHPVLRDIPTSLGEVKHRFLTQPYREITILNPPEKSNVVDEDTELAPVNERTGMDKYWAIVTTGGKAIRSMVPVATGLLILRSWNSVKN